MSRCNDIGTLYLIKMISFHIGMVGNSLIIMALIQSHNIAPSFLVLQSVIVVKILIYCVHTLTFTCYCDITFESVTDMCVSLYFSGIILKLEPYFEIRSCHQCFECKDCCSFCKVSNHNITLITFYVDTDLIWHHTMTWSFYVNLSIV